MDWKWLLFSFQGRINRAKYWLVALVSIVALIIIGVLIASLTTLGGAGALIAIVIGIVCYVGLVWAGLAVAIKRLHDRNKSGWWLLLFYIVPAVLNGVAKALIPDSVAGALLTLIGGIIGIWAFVELGCLRGTDGPNQYGTDPLGHENEPIPAQ
jgi:uncharacterized membrane protein YhaH (DUF805 family)